jgi:uncharacterized protein YaaR (DUF327 family)
MTRKHWTKPRNREVQILLKRIQNTLDSTKSSHLVSDLLALIERMYRPEKGKETREMEEEMKETGKRLENSNTPQANAIRKLYLV